MDKSLLSQILHNIFSNFFKYAGEKTDLSVLFSRTKEGWILSFIDNGIGIPEDELDYVKEKFYRVDKSRTRDADMSMGIGLSIVDRIAKLHGGYLELQNNYPHGLIVRVHMKR
jgi:signal transduction histidine kinase